MDGHCRGIGDGAVSTDRCLGGTATHLALALTTSPPIALALMFVSAYAHTPGLGG